ncbi:helix-turn-helix domain-containing protein [Pseudomonas sp. CGJS7]|uniref:helix-turn-helix domain-containing protein n=1 Tax=Pseudomonas sp. CGJS7 TaxID=3109348 RepID=UPI0030087EA3
MELFSLAIAGFSIVVAALLWLTYVAFLDIPGKSAYSILSCTVLLGALVALQWGHLLHFAGGPAPLDTLAYRIALFVAPSSFFFFGRWALLPDQPFRPAILLALSPIALVLIPRLDVSLPMLFAIGAGFALWLGYLVYGLRAQRKQFRFEFFWFGVMSAIAVAVLALGFALPYIDHAWFYRFYCNAIGAAFAIMVVALIAKPDLLADLTEAAQLRYGKSTLRAVDVDGLLARLAALMADPKVYRNEALTLSTLAADLGVSGHQLSELVNTRLGMGFPRYVRERRVAAAKSMPVAEPNASILAIGLDTGFKSQSTFYAAFKEVTGQSPGDYRKANAKTC